MTNDTSDEIAALTYNQRFLILLGSSVTLIVLSAFWIVSILVAIEANKAAFFSIGDENNNSLSMTVDDSTTSENQQQQVGDGLEHEKDSPSSPTATPVFKGRRVRMSFKLMQLASVSVLILLTYLILVVSEAPMWTSCIGSICVFGMFLRYQIGDELRRQRLDRIILMFSLFLMIASLMSLCTYAHKSLANGEIYEGPARIIGYDQEPYNNTDHDPSKRMDIEVEWGKGWGCPLSGGKVCKANINGAMCTVNTPPGQRRRQRQRRRRTTTTQDRSVAEGQKVVVVEQPSSSPSTAMDLETENEELEQENEDLKKEVEELELTNEETKEVGEEELEVEEEKEEATTNEYDKDIAEVEEEEMEVEKEYTDAYVEVEEQEVKVEEEYENDPDAKAQDEETVEELEEEKDEVDEIYNKYEDEEAAAANQYAEAEENAEEEESEIASEETETENVYGNEIKDVAEGSTSEAEDGVFQEEAEETVTNAIDNAEGITDDATEWVWDEVSYEYDDDAYEAEYWDYDWDSVWGEYACEDMYDIDAYGETYDKSVAAGTDEFPYVTIYGSCKTCEAYVLDYFAERAFESVEEHKRMALAYMIGAMMGFITSIVCFVTYKVRPQAENEIELLDTDSGVMA